MSFTKKLFSLVILTVLLAGVFSIQASASIPYETYNYLNDETRISTPAAYVPDREVNLSNLGIGNFGTPGDLVVGKNGLIYVSDTSNNRIVCLNSDYSVNRVISSFFCQGETQTFNSPDGLWVTDSGVLYVADTMNSRIVALDSNNQAVRVLGRPDTNLIDDNIVFRPTAVAVDKYNRVFTISTGVNLGIIVYDANGDFQNFLGAQKVSYNVLDYLWKRFMTDEQKERMETFIPTEYSNLLVDNDGFVYAVASALDQDDLVSTIKSRDESGRTAPIRKLNHSGYDVLLRTGYFPPVGDVKYEIEDDIPLLSAFVDVTLGAANTYTVLDSQYGRIFTYSQTGDLLYAFGGKSSQQGNNVNPSAITYNGTDLMVLDSASGKISIYKQTEYGALLIEAQEKYNDYDLYDAVAVWGKILELNPNYALAYDGIGSSLLQAGNYAEAMRYFKLSDNMKLYSEAFQGYRSEWIRQYIIPLFLIILLVIILFVLLVRYISKCNKTPACFHKHPFWYEFLYGFYIMFHPFGGFWDVKHEKRGSARAAGVILLLVFGIDVLQRIMTGPIFNSNYNDDIDLIQILMNTTGMALLFILSNWCLTSLMDGKGSMKDIFVSVGYAMLPLFVLKLITIPLSYILISEESMYLSFLNGLAVIWSVGLIFLGIMVTQQYSLGKNTATCILSIAGMGMILFIVLLYLTTVAQIVEFIQLLFYELTR